jgi:hypothetical protein
MKINYLLLSAAILFCVICTYFFIKNQGLIRQLNENNIKLTNLFDTLKTVTDSLNNEVFIYKTNQERYEIAIEMFRIDNPKGYEQLQYIITHKTE